MVVKSELKLIKSLQQKKYRNEHGLFVIEGKKALEELLASTIVAYKVYATNTVNLNVKCDCLQLVSTKELQQMSALKNPNGLLGVFHIPTPEPILFKDWILVLDGIQDPGNLGTIIRLCDWFGIASLVCSQDTVDCYNSKVLQATMGSIARINISYTDVPLFLQRNILPVYGSFMTGASVYKSEFPKKGILVMGNEGKGISDAIKQFCSHSISVPQYGKVTTESLNVGTASAILLNEIRRWD
jgi:TrmH family RNA methyltransferase